MAELARKKIAWENHNFALKIFINELFFKKFEMFLII